MRFGQPLGVGRPPTGSAGMVRQRCLARPSGTKQPYGVGSHQLPLMRLSGRSPTPQKPLRADDPVIQSGQLDPRRVTARCWRRPGESRPPAGGVPSPRPHRLSSSLTRSSGRRGRQAVGVPDGRELLRVDLANSSRSPARGQSSRDGVGRGPQHDARGRASRDGRANAVARGAPVRRVAPRPGPVLPGSHQGSLMSPSPRQGFWSWLSLSR